MNIKQYISAASLALLALGFTACDGKDIPGYTEATRPGDAQRVFFASSSMSKIVSDTVSSFEVNIYRPEAASAESLTVQLFPSFPDPAYAQIFTVPASVTFDAQRNMAQIEVRYDIAAMEANKDYKFSIAVDEANANEYGVSSIAITAVNEQMSEWTLFGYDEALGRDGYGTFTIGSPYQAQTFSPIRVWERHLPSDVKNQQFILQIYDGLEEDEADIEHNKDMNDPDWLEVFAFNSEDGGKSINVPETVFVLDPSVSLADAHTLLPSKYENASSFDPLTGVFTLNIMCFDEEGAWNPADWTINLAGYLDTNDYTISLTDKGQINIGGSDYAIVGYDATKFVEFSAYTLVNSLLVKDENDKPVLDENAYFEVVEGITQQVLDPENATTTYELNTLKGTSQNITFSFPSSGDYTMVAVAFHTDNVNGLEAKSNAYVNFHFKTFNPWDGWTTVSEDATYIDNLVASLYQQPDFANYPITVTIQESDDYEGLYRIVNPYKVFEEEGLEVADFGSIEFDAYDPDQVYFPLSDTGIRNMGNAINLMSTSYYFLANGTDPSELPSIYWGTYKNNKVTLQAFNVEGYSNFLVMLGEDGPFIFDFDFSLDFSATAAEKPGKIAKSLRNAVARNLTPMKGGLKATKAYYKVKKVEKVAKEKKAARPAAGTRLFNGLRPGTKR